MYRVIEVARMLGVSKVTIYKKIHKNKKLLKDCIHLRSNITYVDDQGVAIIKDLIEVSPAQEQGFEEQEEIKRLYLEELSETISFMNRQIHIKKQQIQRKDEIIEAYKAIIKSNRGKLQYLESQLNQPL